MDVKDTVYSTTALHATTLNEVVHSLLAKSSSVLGCFYAVFVVAHAVLCSYMLQGKKKRGHEGHSFTTVQCAL